MPVGQKASGRRSGGTTERDSPGAKMRTAKDVIDRILWDPKFEAADFVVGYLDRFVGIVEKAVTEFNFKDDLATLSHMELAIPSHRIQYVKVRDAVVWDKREATRCDNFFGSFPHNAVKIDEFLRRREVAVEEAEAEVEAEAEEGKEDEDLAAQEVAEGDDPFQGASDRPNFFVCARVLSSRVRQAAKALQESDAVLYEGGLRASLLHFTILTLRLRSELELQRASVALQDFALEDTVHPDEPLEIRGVSCFRNRVLHARLEERANERIVLLHERVRNHMIERLGRRCWVGQSHERFVPHMTISKISRPMSREGKFVNEFSYLGKSEEPLGSTKIRALHLCRMKSPRGQPFYTTFSSRIGKGSLLSEPEVRAAIAPAEAPEGPLETGLSQELAMRRACRALRLRARQIPADLPNGKPKLFLLRAFPGLERETLDAAMQLQALTDAVAVGFGEGREAQIVRALLGGQRKVVVVGRFAHPWQHEVLTRFAAAQGYAVEFLTAPKDAWRAAPVANLLDASREASGWASSGFAAAEEIVMAVAEPKPVPLHVFDFDRTLLMTPDPHRMESPGLWLTLPHSLSGREADTSEGPALHAMRSLDRSECAVVVLSGRAEAMRPYIEHLLGAWGLHPDALVLRSTTSGVSSSFKAHVLEQLGRSQRFSHCTFYDDDVDALRAAEGALEATMPGHFAVKDATRMQQQHPPARDFPSLCHAAKAWLCATFYGVLIDLGAELPEHAATSLGLEFGSAALGRQGTDLDLCLLAPRVTSGAALLEALLRKLRSAAALAPFRVRESYLSKRARCPRVVLSLEAGGQELEVDLVVAALPAEAGLAGLLARHAAGDCSRRELVDVCMAHAAEQEAFRALTGPLFAEDVKGFLAERGVSLAAHGLLLERAVWLLEAAGLRGVHFQCIKTFQLVLLIRSYLERRAADDVSFEDMCGFLGSELSEEDWATALAGVYPENSADLAACNFVYLPRLRQAFRAGDGASQAASQDFLLRCEALGLELLQVTVRSPRPWKTKIAFEAGFPAVVRALVAGSEPGSFLPDAHGPLRAAATMVLRMALRPARGSSLPSLAQRALRSLRLPAGATMAAHYGQAEHGAS